MLWQVIISGNEAVTLLLPLKPFDILIEKLFEYLLDWHPPNAKACVKGKPLSIP